MTWVRNTGFVVSLVLLASVVCHFAVKRQFERHLQSINETSLLASENGQLQIPPPDFGDASSLGVRRLLTNRSRRKEILQAFQLEEDKGDNDRDRQNDDAQTDVPNPNDGATGEARNSEGNSAVREVIERELSHASREERDIWFDELKSLPSEVVRDLLQVRKQLHALPRLLGSMPERLVSADPTIATRAREITAEPASQKIRFHTPDYSGASTALEAAISQLRHNLMNASTPGFKRLRVSLVDSYSSRPLESDSSSELVTETPTNEISRGNGCRIAPLRLDLKQGLLKKTGRQLDLAVDGEGFFVVQRGDRVLLTRCGAFAIDRDRQMCLTLAEDRILVHPTIKIPESVREFQISADGAITILKSGENVPTLVGRLQLARVANPTRLQPIGQTLFVANEESGSIMTGAPMADGFGDIQQGCLEQSNVDLQAELDEIEEFNSILKALPFPSTRPVTASSPRQTSPQ